jgi:dTDP-4-amino-4,6-dideoxygalactose transaminase
MNSRLDEMQAAILRVKLRHLSQDNERRERLARVYLDALKGWCLRLPASSSESVHVWHLFVVAHQHRDELLGFLRERGIGASIHYPVQCIFNLPIGTESRYAFPPRCKKLAQSSACLCTGAPRRRVGQVAESVLEWVH